LVALLTSKVTAFSKFGRDAYEQNGLRGHTEKDGFFDLPLKNIFYDVKIENNLAKVEIS